MPVQVDITRQGDILVIRLTGVMEPGPFRRRAGAVKEITDACRSGDFSGLLIDVRGVDLRIDRTDIYEAAFALGRPLVRGVKIAAVVDEHHLQPDGIFKKLVGLAGVVLRVFTDREEATAWLEAPAKPGTRKRPRRRARSKGSKRGRKKR